MTDLHILTSDLIIDYVNVFIPLKKDSYQDNFQTVFFSLTVPLHVLG